MITNGSTVHLQVAGNGTYAKPCELKRNNALISNRGYMRRSSVSSLFASGSPSDISEFVMTLIVDSVESVLGVRLTSDVFNEFRERRELETDSPSSVVLVRLIALTGASLFGVGISAILCGCPQAWFSHGNNVLGLEEGSKVKQECRRYFRRRLSGNEFLRRVQRLR